MKALKTLQNESGTMRHGIGLMLVMIILLAIFYYIDKTDDETPDFGFDKETGTFMESETDAIFNDDDILNQNKTYQASQPILKDVDEKDLEEDDDPSRMGKSSKNSFYTPPSPERRREAESTSNSYESSDSSDE